MALGLTTWDPFREFDRLDRLLRRGGYEGYGRSERAIAAPAIELNDEGDHYLVRAELPGVSEDDVEITLSGNVLSLRGEKRVERRASKTVETTKAESKKEAKGQQGEEQTHLARSEGESELGRPLYSEVFYGNFERVITLPDDIDSSSISATAENGVFYLTIGKKPEQRARRISVTRH